MEYLSNKQKKRLKKDMMGMINEPIENIFFNWNENNLLNCQIVIVGASNTPFNNGFYCIDINCTKDFPYKHPNARFYTTDGKVRLHPNLYENGKICLSLIGTWAGPQWTSCQGIKSLSLSIQSLLNKHPIQNEPGYEMETGKLSKRYNDCIKHANIRVGVIQMIEHTPTKFKPLRDNMIEYFLKNYTWYEKICLKRLNKNKNENIRAPIYRAWYENFNYGKLLKKLRCLKEKVSPPKIYVNPTSNTLESEKPKSKTKTKTKTKTKKIKNSEESELNIVKKIES